MPWLIYFSYFRNQIIHSLLDWCTEWFDIILIHSVVCLSVHLSKLAKTVRRSRPRRLRPIPSSDPSYCYSLSCGHLWRWLDFAHGCEFASAGRWADVWSFVSWWRRDDQSTYRNSRSHFRYCYSSSWNYCLRSAVASLRPDCSLPRFSVPSLSVTGLNYYFNWHFTC